MKTETLSFDTANDHIKRIAGRHANEGIITIASYLYRGRMAKDSGEAPKMMHYLKNDDGLGTFNALQALAQLECD